MGKEWDANTIGRVFGIIDEALYQEDLEKYKNDIIWLPEDPAELKGNLPKGSKR